MFSKPDYVNTFFFYNAKDHVLLVLDGNSATYIRKLELDLNKDTLSVRAYKRFFFTENNPVNSAFDKWKIKLEPNVSFVRHGNTLTPLSELRKFPDDIYPPNLDLYYYAIEIFPKRFPSVSKR